MSHTKWLVTLLVLSACNGSFKLHRRSASASQPEQVEEAKPSIAPFKLTHKYWVKKSGSKVALTWDQAVGATKYKLTLTSDAACATVVKEVDDLKVTSYDFDNLADGLYYVCLRAFGDGITLDATNNGRKLLLTSGFSFTQSSPLSSWSDGQRLVVADTGNHRVLIWNNFPTSSTIAADLVLGQPDLTTVTANTGGVSAQSLNSPITVHSDGVRLIVADYVNNRVLIWNSFPTTMRQAADVVVGQGSMSTNALATTAAGMRRPSSAFSDGEKLYVTEDQNRRVTIFNSIPTTNGASASVVLGQAGSFVTNAWDGAGCTISSIDDPSAVAVDSGKLFVADSGNNRVLIWNTIPTAQTNPDVVIGQPDFTTATANTGGASAARLNYPTGVSISGGKLYISDRSNNRVLRWDSVPTTNSASATKVYGQPDFATVTTNTGGLSLNSMDQPQTTFATDDFVIVSELGNNRTLLLPLEQ